MIGAIQHFDVRTGSLDHSIARKVKKIISHGCLHKVNNDAYICRPIIGYNKTTYTLLRMQTGMFRCDCQGYRRRGQCTHATALDIMLNEKEKQGALL